MTSTVNDLPCIAQIRMWFFANSKFEGLHKVGDKYDEIWFWAKNTQPVSLPLYRIIISGAQT